MSTDEVEIFVQQDKVAVCTATLQSLFEYVGENDIAFTRQAERAVIVSKSPRPFLYM